MSADVILTVHTQHHDTGRFVHADNSTHSLRNWSCSLLDGRPKATHAHLLPYVKKVEFVLHETFDDQHRVVSHPPYKIQEEGWGEFDLLIIVHFVNCPEPYKIVHDLSFHDGESYQKNYDFTVPNPSAGFLALFNKHATVSRKTIPARATKARKGPPRDSAYAASNRSTAHRAYASDSSHTADSDTSAGASDDDVSDSHSSVSRSSKARSSSSASGDSLRKGDRGRSRLLDSAARPIAAQKHIPQESPAQARNSTSEHHPTAHSRPGASHSLHTLPQNEDLRHQRQTTTKSQSGAPPLSLSRTKRDPAGSTAMRRAAKASAAADSSLQKQNRPSLDVLSKSRPLAHQSLGGNSDKSISPPGRGERLHASATSGVKRRLTDALESPANSRRRTLATGEQPAAPSLAASINSVKVPKKKSLKALDQPTDCEKRATTVRDSLDDWDDKPSPSLQPPQTQPTTGLSGRESFVRERERQRQLERQRESASLVGSAGMRTVRLGTAGTTAAAAAATGAGGTTKAPRPANAATGSARNGRVNTLSAKVDAADQVGESLSHKTPRRDGNPDHNAVASMKSAPKLEIISTPGDSKQRDSSPDTPASSSRVGVAGSAGQARRAMPLERTASSRSDSAFASPPADLTRKMERIMARAELLNEGRLVGFLHLLHALRLEQEPERSDSITEEAFDHVRNDGEYVCNLAVLNPDAIDRLWAFVREVRA